MRTIAKAISFPTEAEIGEDGGLYHYTAAIEDIILSDTAPTVEEAAEEIVRFLAFWTSRKGYSVGAVRDVAETLAVAVSLETGANVKKVYRKLISL